MKKTNINLLFNNEKNVREKISKLMKEQYNLKKSLGFNPNITIDTAHLIKIYKNKEDRIIICNNSHSIYMYADSMYYKRIIKVIKEDNDYYILIGMTLYKIDMTLTDEDLIVELIIKLTI